MKIINFFCKREKKTPVVMVIGDSHTRAFSFNQNFSPMFIGAGKQHNFINDRNYLNVKTKIQNIIKNLSKTNVLILFFGEPDTRFLLEQGWTPWIKNSFKDLELKQTLKNCSIDDCVNRYKNLISIVKKENKVFVLSVSPSVRIEQNKIVKKYNQKLRQFCADLSIDFIDLESKTMLGENLNHKYYGDIVHLNNKIQIDVENYLLRKGILQKSHFNQKFEWENKKVQKEYVFNKKFGCFMLKKDSE